VLLIDRWSGDLVERVIADRCRHAEANTWQEIAQKLPRFAHWEFEDYRQRA
jgi:hypothetical protein